MRKFIKILLEFITKLISAKRKESRTKDVPKDSFRNVIKEAIRQILLEFVIGVIYSAIHPNTKKIREIINFEFKFLNDSDFSKTDLQCTEYVQFRVRQKLGITIKWPVKTGRDGGKWADIFEKYGIYKVLDSPRVGCAVSFKEKHGPYGHIAFVEEVLENETIKISEANYPGSGKYSERILPKLKWQNQYKCRFIDFS